MIYFTRRLVLLNPSFYIVLPWNQWLYCHDSRNASTLSQQASYDHHLVAAEWTSKQVMGVGFHELQVKIKCLLPSSKDLPPGCLILFWLVVSTPLKNIRQNGNLPQIGVKIKNTASCCRCSSNKKKKKKGELQWPHGTSGWCNLEMWELPDL